MKSYLAFAASVALITPSLAVGQTTSEPTAAAPLIVGQAPPANELVLPANTEITLAMNDDLSTKKAREGDNFDLTVAADVMLCNYVIIPKGSRGAGEVTWRTGKGAFGKSGKMEIELRYVEVGGRRVPVTGSYRQEGDGNTVATIGTVIIAGVFSALVTGKSGTIPRGRELVAHTKDALPIMLAGTATPAVVAPVVVPAVVAVPVAVKAPSS